MKYLLNQRFYMATIVIIMFCKCNVNAIYVNKEEDKQKATEISEQFYKLLEAKAYKDVMSLFGERFYLNHSKLELDDFLKRHSSLLGRAKYKALISWNTKRMEGTSPSAEYRLEYHVIYNFIETTEKFFLEREKNGDVKIVSYDSLDR